MAPTVEKVRPLLVSACDSFAAGTDISAVVAQAARMFGDDAPSTRALVDVLGDEEKLVFQWLRGLIADGLVLPRGFSDRAGALTVSLALAPTAQNVTLRWLTEPGFAGTGAPAAELVEAATTQLMDFDEPIALAGLVELFTLLPRLRNAHVLEPVAQRLQAADGAGELSAGQQDRMQLAMGLREFVEGNPQTAAARFAEVTATPSLRTEAAVYRAASLRQQAQHAEAMDTLRDALTYTTADTAIDHLAVAAQAAPLALALREPEEMTEICVAAFELATELPWGLVSHHIAMDAARGVGSAGDAGRAAEIAAFAGKKERRAVDWIRHGGAPGDADTFTQAAIESLGLAAGAAELAGDAEQAQQLQTLLANLQTEIAAD
ncbi:hypothetical protein [Corynebacterium ulceribovis]|uniref:hypothetical protein n=1 Tax=Corynebacterium ulceribovis TaxID=487732 RepID=UPI000382C1E4|nr:hypothetical protein [Corynebacterium ulceribovis]